MRPITEAFFFSSPTQSIFGVNSSECVGRKAAKLGKRAFIVTDGYLSTTESFGKILSSLSVNGVETTVVNNVVPNPLDIHVHEGAEAYRENGCDMIVAVGGGSSIDSAKTIGAIITNGGKTQDLLEEDSVKNPLPPFIAVPTTAGTGSEVTVFAVITDSQTHEKLILFSPYLLPTIAILDPQITVSLPQNQTVFTGLDALTHAIEAYTTRVSNPVSDGIAMHSIELIGKYIETVYENGNDIEARSGMLLGSHMAGIAFSNSDLGSAHTMGEVLASACNIPHGAAMAIFLPYVMDFSLEAAVEKYARVARLLGADTSGISDKVAAKKAIEYIKELERKLKLPSLSTFNIDPKCFDSLAKACKEHVCDPINPMEIKESEYRELFHKASDNFYEI
jgi:alcohol dehydrogenase